MKYKTAQKGIKKLLSKKMFVKGILICITILITVTGCKSLIEPMSNNFNSKLTSETILSNKSSEISFQDNGKSMGECDENIQSRSNASKNSDGGTSMNSSINSISNSTSVSSGVVIGDNEIKTPAIMKTTYVSRDVIVADYVVTNKAYNADNKGLKDCTQAIQDAINDCHNDGGGTVFLPRGKYRINKGITIRAFVTLRGDYQDPDIGNDYGTVIIADVASSINDLPALFTIGGSAGVMGLTVYYPNQNINDVKEYPFTFNIPGAIPNVEDYMLSSIIDCTVINGYKGVVASKYNSAVNEQINIDGLKGTFLKTGLELYNSADASVIQNVKLSNHYWEDAGAGFSGANRLIIDAYTKANARGFVFGDLEWSLHSRLYASDYNIGMHIVEGLRGNGTQFDGGIYDVKLLNCKTGLKVDAIDSRVGFGMALAKATITASDKAIINNTDGNIKIQAILVTGGISGVGKNKVLVNLSSQEIYPSNDLPRTHSIPISKLYDVKNTYKADNTAQAETSKIIQKALDDAYAHGGGIVYLAAGFYKLSAKLIIPAGVELRGATSVGTRDQIGMSKGTVLMAFYGAGSMNPDSDAALITLQGNDAGICDLRIVYPEYNVAKEYKEKGKITKYPFTIRGIANNNYIYNIGFVGVYKGIEMLGATSYFIKNISASIYETGIRIKNSQKGYISTCLSNITNMSRQGYWHLWNYPQLFKFGWYEGSEEQFYDQIIVPILMKSYKYLDFINSTDLYVENVFSYGSLNTITISGGDVVCANVGADTYYKMTTTGPMLIAKNNASLKVINLVRFNGTSYFQEPGSLIKLYNRITIYQSGELDKTN